MKQIRLFLIIALCGNLVLLRAQDNKGDEGDLYKENYALKKELKKKVSQIGELELKLAKMSQEKKEADSLLKVEKAIGKSKEVKSQLQALEKENKTLKTKLEECSGSVEEAFKKQLKSDQDVMAQFQQQHARDSVEIETLKRDLADLSGFRKMWIAQLAESVNEKWLEKPYSKIDIAELETALKQYEEFASSDKKIADARDKLRNLLQSCRIYKQGVDVVNSPYNKAIIKNIALSVKNLRDKTTDATKKEELSLLYWQLDNYGITIEIFQDVIKAVDEQITDQVNHRSAWPLVKAVLDKQEKEDEYITAIKQIPWLSQQYNLYYEALEKNCVAPNHVHDIIMNLQP